MLALSPVQLEVLQVIWDQGETTVGEVHRILSARRGVARNTVLTHMNRLVQKGWLSRREEGGVFQYSATSDRRQTLNQMVTQMVEAAFQGSAEDLVLALVDGRGLSKQEAERIRALIDQARQKRGAK